MTAPTQADLDRVTALAHELALKAQETFAESPLSPLLALAALTMSACQVAVVTDTSYIQLMELVTIHFQAAGAGLAVQELDDQKARSYKS